MVRLVLFWMIWKSVIKKCLDYVKIVTRANFFFILPYLKLLTGNSLKHWRVSSAAQIAPKCITCALLHRKGVLSWNSSELATKYRFSYERWNDNLFSQISRDKSLKMSHHSFLSLPPIKLSRHRILRCFLKTPLLLRP